MAAVSADAARHGTWGIPSHHRHHGRRHMRQESEDHPLVELVRDMFSVPAYSSVMRPQGSIFGGETEISSSPRIEVSEDENGTVELVMELPGVSARDLNIEVENDHVLRVQGVRTRRKNGYLSKSEFDQTIRLKDTVDVDKLEANLSAGVLTITVPQKPTKIKKLSISSKDPGSILDHATTPTKKPKGSKKKIEKNEDEEVDFDDDEII
eukprot:Sro87_g046070.2  (209) ;mRNA; r:53711-54337